MKYLRLFSLIASLFLSSCATTGVQFNRISDIPSDKGIIYLFRTIDIVPGLNLYSYAVFDGNEEQMCELLPNGYCLIYANPGEVQMSAQTRQKGSISFNVESGHEYFVSAGVMVFEPGNSRPLFTLVSNKIGLEEISSCRLLQTTETEWIVGTKTVQPIYESIQFPPSEVPINKSIACFYRDWKMLSAMDDFRISEKNQEIGTLKNGSYFCKATNPEKHIYSISVNQPGFFRSSKVYLKPGVINYFRFSVVDYSFNPVEETEGFKIITNMKKE
jgi:hypothetical protein